MMVKYSIFAVAAIAFTSLQANALTCEQLDDEWEFGNKRLASIFAQGITDNSAPRATNRELKEVNIRLRQQMALTMMIDMDCPLPASLSEPNEYISPALKCETDSLSETSPDSCNLADWQKSEETQ